jgi:AraC family transcriptional regulator
MASLSIANAGRFHPIDRAAAVFREIADSLRILADWGAGMPAPAGPCCQPTPRYDTIIRFSHPRNGQSRAWRTRGFAGRRKEEIVSRILGHGKAKYTTGQRLESSERRGWRGMLAERWRHAAGDLGEVKPRETEVIVMFDGRLRVRRRGDGRLQYHEATPGTVWLCPAGIGEDMIHLYDDIEESLHMYLPASPLSSAAFEELGLDPDRVRLRYEGGFHDPLIEQIGRAVHAELRHPGAFGGLLIETLSAALSVYLLQNYSSVTPSAAALPPARGGLDRRRLARVIDFIEDNLGRELSLEELARVACLSPYHFVRSFRAAVGRTPHRYLVDRRVARAEALLKGGDLSLSQVADLCGFASQAHFTSAFKRVAGTTPGAYRISR